MTKRQMEEDVRRHNTSVPSTMSGRLGFAYTPAKYKLLLPGDLTDLEEGASQIATLGGSGIKVMFGKNHAKTYPHNSKWPDGIRTMTDLARTHNFHKLFSDDNIKTYFLDCPGMTDINYKHGLTREDQQQLYDEMYNFTLHLRQTYDSKVFILQNWEGDNAFNINIQSWDVMEADMGYINYFNIRQDAVNTAKQDSPTSTVQIWHTAECNHLPIPPYTHKLHFISESVFPYTYCDLYSLSSWSTSKENEYELRLSDMFDYIKSKVRDSPSFLNKNVILGEYGGAENVMLDGDEGQRAHCGRQTEEVLRWGAPFICWWGCYGNEYRNGIIPSTSPTPITDDQLKGNYLWRPISRTTTMAYDYFQSIFDLDAIEYSHTYEYENQIVSSANRTFSTLAHKAASGAFYRTFNAQEIGDNITTKVRVQHAAKYRVSIIHLQTASGGIFRVDMDNSYLGKFNGYSTINPSRFTTTILSNPLFITDPSSIKELSFTCIGKDSGSTGFVLNVDAVRIVPDIIGLG